MELIALLIGLYTENVDGYDNLSWLPHLRLFQHYWQCQDCHPTTCLFLTFTSIINLYQCCLNAPSNYLLKHILYLSIKKKLLVICTQMISFCFMCSNAKLAHEYSHNMVLKLCVTNLTTWYGDCRTGRFCMLYSTLHILQKLLNHILPCTWCLQACALTFYQCKPYEMYIYFLLYFFLLYSIFYFHVWSDLKSENHVYILNSGYWC